MVATLTSFLFMMWLYSHHFFFKNLIKSTFLLKSYATVHPAGFESTNKFFFLAVALSLMSFLSVLISFLWHYGKNYHCFSLFHYSQDQMGAKLLFFDVTMKMNCCQPTSQPQFLAFTLLFPAELIHLFSQNGRYRLF